MQKVSLLISLLVLLLTGRINAQLSPATSGKNQYSVLFGLNQPIVFHGFNAEINYWTKKMIFDYSHGFGLKVDGKFIDKSYEQQHLKFRIAHSLGFGVGYRFTEAFNLRFEPKVHLYETFYDDQSYSNASSLRNFKTYTLGLGAYYRWMPFSKASNGLKGITVAPSIRYWHKVGSSLEKNGYSYLNARTQKMEHLKAPNIGISNTPVLVNISIGYTF
jgi:hypothetical protein